ncbi:hypothetical protein D3C87_1180990 [compost metagenome]
MASTLDEDQFVIIGRLQVIVDITQKTRWVAVRKAIIGTDDKRARMLNLFDLREVPIRLDVDVVQRVGIQPLVGGIGYARKPTQQWKWEHFLAPALFAKLEYELALLLCDDACQVLDIRWAQEDKLRNPCVDVSRQIVNGLVYTQ